MTYIAKHYVKIAGRVYTPGELIPGDAVAPRRCLLRSVFLLTGCFVP